MIKIISSRGSGKTLKLIQQSSEKQIPILCTDSFQKRHIMEEAATYHYKIPVPLLVTDVLSGNYKEDKATNVLVDELEVLTRRMLSDFNVNLKGYTISKKDFGEELYEI